MMTREKRDETLLRYAEGEMSQLEARQVERELAADPAARQLAEDMRVLVDAARAAGGPVAPGRLHEQARSDLAAVLVGAAGESSPPRGPRRALAYGAAAALVVGVWLAAGASVADVVEGVKKGVRVLLLGQDDEVLQDLTIEGSLTAGGDTLHIDLDLDEVHGLADVSQDMAEIRLGRGTEDGGTVIFRASGSEVFRVETSSDMQSSTGGPTFGVSQGNAAQVDSHVDTLRVAGGHGRAKAAVEDSLQPRTWGQVKMDRANP